MSYMMAPAVNTTLRGSLDGTVDAIIAKKLLEQMAKPSMSAKERLGSEDKVKFVDQSNSCGFKMLDETSIEKDKFTSCLSDKVDISSSCSDCYNATEDFSEGAVALIFRVISDCLFKKGVAFFID